jgi:hypothetical protein
MFHIRPEAGDLKPGFNIYPWSDRRYNVGFILMIGEWAWKVRYAPHVRRFYSYTMRLAA